MKLLWQKLPITRKYTSLTYLLNSLQTKIDSGGLSEKWIHQYDISVCRFICIVCNNTAIEDANTSYIDAFLIRNKPNINTSNITVFLFIYLVFVNDKRTIQKFIGPADTDIVVYPLYPILDYTLGLKWSYGKTLPDSCLSLMVVDTSDTEIYYSVLKRNLQLSAQRSIRIEHDFSVKELRYKLLRRRQDKLLSTIVMSINDDVNICTVEEIYWLHFNAAKK